MKGKFMLVLIAIGLGFAKYKHLINIKTGWIVLILFAWFILTFISIHNRNKKESTPSPVYIVDQ